MPSAVVIESSGLIRSAVVRALEQAGYQVLKSASEFSNAIPAQAGRSDDPDLLVWGLERLSIRVLRDLSQVKRSSTPTLILVGAVSNWPALLPAALGNCVRAIIHRHTDEEHLSAALSALAQGFIVIDPIAISQNGGPQQPTNSELAADLFADGPFLTKRQRDVANLLVSGWSNRDIAEHLGVQVGTVKSHVRSILRKSGAASRIQLVLMSQSGTSSLPEG